MWSRIYCAIVPNIDRQSQKIPNSDRKRAKNLQKLPKIAMKKLETATAVDLNGAKNKFISKTETWIKNNVGLTSQERNIFLERLVFGLSGCSSSISYNIQDKEAPSRGFLKTPKSQLLNQLSKVL